MTTRPAPRWAGCAARARVLLAAALPVSYGIKELAKDGHRPLPVAAIAAGLLVAVLFLTLFGSTTYIQVFQAKSLNADSRNARTMYNEFGRDRGPLVVPGDPDRRDGRVPRDERGPGRVGEQGERGTGVPVGEGVQGGQDHDQVAQPAEQVDDEDPHRPATSR